MRSPEFVQQKKVRIILREVNAKLNDGDKPVSKTTLLCYHKIGLDKRRAIGAPPTIPLILLTQGGREGMFDCSTMIGGFVGVFFRAPIFCYEPSAHNKKLSS